MQRFLGIDLFGRNKHLQSAALADQSRQTLGPSPTGNQSQSGASMSENRARRSNSMVTSKRKVQSAAHAVSGNRGIDRSRKLCESSHERLTHLGECMGSRAGEGRDFFQVCPGRKKSLVSGDYERP